MKRFFPIIISVVLLCSIVFTGCSSSENTQTSPEDALTANHELFTGNDSESEINMDNEKFTSIITEWAEKNSIEVTHSDENYIVLSKDNSGELKNVESFTFHTFLDFKSESAAKHSMETAAVVMTVLETAHNHGPLRGIFTFSENGQPTGTKVLDTKYLDYDNFIDVTYNKDTTLYTTFPAVSDMSAVKDLELAEPAYTKAYRISFSGVQDQSAYKNRGVYPNPIKAIGDLLASCQTSTVLFELASFEGGKYTDQIPGKATATIVLHENDVESFTKRFDNSYKKIEDIYKEIDDESITFEYVMEPVDLPSQVICKEDTENIVSLMYTMISGTYLRNENDEVQAYSNTGCISTENGLFKLDINARSLNDEVMTELEGVVKTICGLSDISYKKNAGTRVWSNPAETPLVSSLSESLNAEASSALEMMYIDEIINKDPDINLISLGTKLDNADKDLEKVFEYISIAGVDLAE